MQSAERSSYLLGAQPPSTYIWEPQVSVLEPQPLSARKRGISTSILHLRWPTYLHPNRRGDLTSSHLPLPTLSTLHFSGIHISGDGDLSSGSQEPRACEEVHLMPMFRIWGYEAGRSVFAPLQGPLPRLRVGPGTSLQSSGHCSLEGQGQECGSPQDTCLHHGRSCPPKPEPPLLPLHTHVRARAHTQTHTDTHTHSCSTLGF